MEPISVSSVLTTGDWQAYLRAAAIRAQNPMARRWLVITFFALALITYVMLEVSETLGLKVTFGKFSFVLGVVAALVGLFAYRRFIIKDLQPSDWFIGPCRFEFGEETIQIWRQGTNSSIRWARVRDITESTDYIYLWIDRLTAYVLPVRDLPSAVNRHEFLAQLQSWMAASRGEDKSMLGDWLVARGLELEGQLATSSKQPSGTLVVTIFRLLTLRKSNWLTSFGNDRTVAILSALSICLWVLVDFIRTGTGAQFSFYNVPTIALITLVLIFFSFVLSRRSRPVIDFRQVFAALLVFLPVVIVAFSVIDAYAPRRIALLATLLLVLYAFFYFVRALTALSGKRQLGSVATGLLVIGVFWLLEHSSYLDASVWYVPESENPIAKSTRATWEQGEALLFDQRDRIDTAIAKINRPANAESAFFFVGFAGVASQKVFAEEINLASKVVGLRYASSDQSLLLVNDQRDLNTLPLATTSGLRYALQRLAAKMDGKRDVLFLALSSHGSHRPSISVSNGSLPLKDVTGEDLAAALKNSGIKWRVVVISSCYAGGFIPYLRDPYTIVITAASADKTSFGCSDDRDLTYFGEAFYRDAFPQTKSLTAAFELARAAIAKREKEESVTESQPQAFFGKELQEKLQEPGPE